MQYLHIHTYTLNWCENYPWHFSVNICIAMEITLKLNCCINMGWVIWPIYKYEQGFIVVVALPQIKNICITQYNFTRSFPKFLFFYKEYNVTLANNSKELVDKLNVKKYYLRELVRTCI